MIEWHDVNEKDVPREENYFLISDGDDLGLIFRSKMGKNYYCDSYVCECYKGSWPFEFKYWAYTPKTPNELKLIP